MLLAVDIGNSSISIGVFTDDEPLVGRIETHPLRTPEEYRKHIETLLKGAAEGAIISSVVPGHTEAMRAAVREITGKEPLILGHTIVKGIRFDIANPGELGADRIAAAAAAVELYGAPVAVVDFGTATTVSFIGRGNVYKGGAIMPGLGLMSKALATWTAKLPEVGGVIAPRVTDPLLSEGGTASQIVCGIIYGTAGGVERIIAEFESKEHESCRVAATGGYFSAIRPYLRRVDFVEPSLVLKGLKFIYNSNRGQSDA